MKGEAVSNESVIREYYVNIDQSNVDWVVPLFQEDAVYERADAVYRGRREIEHFFRRERQIQGVHKVEDVIASASGDTVIAFGRFTGTGATGDARDVGFADVWEFALDGRVRRRRTLLALGSAYVRQ